jgi:hypothetical protein
MVNKGVACPGVLSGIVLMSSIGTKSEAVWRSRVLFFDGVGAGFVTPNPAFDMFDDLRIGEFLWVNNGGVGFDDLEIATFADKGKAGNDFVGFAEEHSCYHLGLFCVAWFADNLAIEINDGIGTNDEGIGIFFSDGLCLCEG